MQTNGGHLIKYLRKKNGVTQAQLAKKLFMTQGMLSNIEKGDAKLSIMDFKVAFAVLGVVTEDFWIVYLNEEEFEGYLLHKEIIQLLEGGGEYCKNASHVSYPCRKPFGKAPLYKPAPVLYQCDYRCRSTGCRKIGEPICCAEENH